MLTMDKITIDQPLSKKKNKYGYLYLTTQVDYNGRMLIGIDPGVNFGLAIIMNGELNVMWGRMPFREKIPGLRAEQAYELAYEFASDAIVVHKTLATCVVEGAAYNSRFGQVGLEEVRVGFYLGLRHVGLKAHIVPPATIKKEILGHGRAQAGDAWPWLNHNAADAISVCLYAQLLKGEDV